MPYWQVPYWFVTHIQLMFYYEMNYWHIKHDMWDLTHWYVTGRNGCCGDGKCWTRFYCVFICVKYACLRHDWWVCEMSSHCNTLQHTATHCNTLQHTATHWNTLQHSDMWDVTEWNDMWWEGMDTAATADVAPDFIVNSCLSHDLSISEIWHVRRDLMIYNRKEWIWGGYD